MQPLVEAGIAWVRSNADWLEEFYNEVWQFPPAKHDDQVDSMVHGLAYLRGAGGMEEFYRRQIERRKAKEAAVHCSETHPGGRATGLRDPLRQ